MIFVTGGNGFIASALIKKLVQFTQVKASVSTYNSNLFENNVDVVIANLIHHQDWEGVFDGVDVVIHCAGRAHITSEFHIDPLAEYRKINVYGTVFLAKQAARSGVKRFIFISSIKVNGEVTSAGSPYFADQDPDPQSEYAISKMEAEKELSLIAKYEKMEVVIIRPPLVYGPGVKANFEVLLKFIYKGLPLPFGLISNNRRSFVALDNLLDFIILCIYHPSAANQIFLVSDGKSISTLELLKKIRGFFGSKSIFIPIPFFILRILFVILRKDSAMRSLMESLEIDINKNKEILGWEPAISIDEGLNQTIKHFIKNNSMLEYEVMCRHEKNI